MENNKQTAVDYIDEAIDKYLAYSVEGSHKAEPFTITDLCIAVEQAKEMEKHQIINTAMNCYSDALGKKFISSQQLIEYAKEYYNEEYGKL